MNPTKEFHILNKFLGWGDNPLESNLWFVGLEGGGCWNNENFHQIKEHQENSENTFGKVNKISHDSDLVFQLVKDNQKSDGGRSLVVQYESKICTLLSRKLKNDHNEWRKYKKFLWLKGSKVFHCNLFPIERKTNDSSNWDDIYKVFFGFNNFTQMIESKEIKSRYKDMYEP